MGVGWAKAREVEARAQEATAAAEVAMAWPMVEGAKVLEGLVGEGKGEVGCLVCLR